MTRARCLAIGLLAALFGGGCDSASVGALLYFLGPEPKLDPELRRLASDDKEVKVAVLVTTRGLETRPELIQADRQLADVFAKQLRDQCAANQERVAIVSPRKVEDFKSSNPNWQGLDAREIGRQFGADFLIEVELDGVSLYEEGGQDLFRGRAEVSLSVVEVTRAERGTDRRQLKFVFPSEGRGPIPAGFEASAPQFRQAFLYYVAKRLAWQFTGHSPQEERATDWTAVKSF
jgi:hypothetical protein